ncbi:dTDP-4-dehydrorhamnose 3,5-epimerase family protein [Amycolatopsis suaedae]|uniref:dTDP-4-keto-6-deoxy-D-glucose epimerase n=1 Tax=Amycolatopsis suaedae TaxID=2510978 RepID=A0A4Q7J426_9PSEU|nr:dTDP-4-dehydrorhamnose 3,5-epimerase [Amycolatopsis suaedae]RZQ60734.1 dTDP-4-keto-6-deoxy-D-glucose epimerase [Amycolatopsis suaedae]
MQVRQLAVRDSYEFIPAMFPDQRGMFTAPFQESVFVETVGHRLHLAQSNHSVSVKGTIRGVHFADIPPGQAKYVYCPKGSLLDVVVDIRVGSPTFGEWDVVRLDSTEYRAMYLAEGLGHAFMALEDDTLMSYLCSTGYNPGREHGISPMDPALNLPWPADLEPVLSQKDIDAPTLAEAKDAGLLPHYDDCLAYYDKLRTASH